MFPADIHCWADGSAKAWCKSWPNALRLCHVVKTLAATVSTMLSAACLLTLEPLLGCKDPAEMWQECEGMRYMRKLKEYWYHNEFCFPAMVPSLQATVKHNMQN